MHRGERSIASRTDVVPLDAVRCLPHAARWFATGRSLPELGQALIVAETLRRSAMGAARRLFGPDRLPAPLQSHADEGPAAGHLHPFWLCEDADDDGRIDHLLVYAPRALGSECQAALRLAQPLGGDGPLPRCRITLDWLGSARTPSTPGRLLAPHRRWISHTPYLSPWHLRRSMDVVAAVRAECQVRDLPFPRVELVDTPPARFTLRRRNGAQPPAGVAPAWLRLDFTSAVAGPIALGWGCHFGLGLFRHAD